ATAAGVADDVAGDDVAVRADVDEHAVATWREDPVTADREPAGAVTAVAPLDVDAVACDPGHRVRLEQRVPRVVLGVDADAGARDAVDGVDAARPDTALVRAVVGVRVLDMPDRIADRQRPGARIHPGPRPREEADAEVAHVADRRAEHA